MGALCILTKIFVSLEKSKVFAMTSYLRQVIHLPLDITGILQSHEWEIFTLLTQCQDF